MEVKRTIIRISPKGHADLKIFAAKLSKKLGKRYTQSTFVEDVLKIKDLDKQLLKVLG